jgi:hypothetical protein
VELWEGFVLPTGLMEVDRDELIPQSVPGATIWAFGSTNSCQHIPTVVESDEQSSSQIAQYFWKTAIERSVPLHQKLQTDGSSHAIVH